MTSIHDFVVSKAVNMRAMLEPYVKTPEHKALMEKYKVEDVEMLVHTYLAPLYATGLLDTARDTLVKELGITDAATKDKIGRYFLCFCEAMLVKKD